MAEIKLGDKVFATCYLKRNKKEIRYYPDTGEIFEYDGYNKEIEICDLDKVRVKEIKECNKFYGYICGKKRTHTSIYTSCEEPEYGGAYQKFFKDDYLECYEICFEYAKKWCKRLVPAEKVVKI